MLLYVPPVEQLFLNIDRPNLIQLVSLLESRLQIMRKCFIEVNLCSPHVHINYDDLKIINSSQSTYI